MFGEIKLGTISQGSSLSDCFHPQIYGLTSKGIGCDSKTEINLVYESSNRLAESQCNSHYTNMVLALFQPQLV